MKASDFERIQRIEGKNLLCAKIIALEPLKYQGLMQEWAQRILGGSRCTS